ncbi:NADPH-dependent F420 reductase [Paenibacillus sp. GCM10027627]|uniref:NADPH-dependent F420 reductase n=1 Tax=unclassified Paenibacillus TaxID=185978 RepID=UPI00362EE25A
MKIAIIGTGYIGGNLTRVFTKSGHEVSIANSSNTHVLQALADETGATPATINDVTQGAEVVIISIPQKNIPDLPSGFLDKITPGAIVIDTGNYYPLLRDGLIEPIEKGIPESRWVEQQIKYPVIKALNASLWYNLTPEVQAGLQGRLAMPVAGDNPEAKAIAFKLVEEVGFDPVDAGGLDDSWRLQPGSPAYCVELDVHSMRKALSDATNVRKSDVSAIHLSNEELKTAQGMQAAFLKDVGRAIQILMESNDWSEAVATKALYNQFAIGNKLPADILQFVFENKSLVPQNF